MAATVVAASVALLAVVLGVSIGPRLAVILRTLSHPYEPGVRPAPERCALLGGPGSAAPMAGSEDTVSWRDGVVLVSSGDLHHALSGSAPARPGAIFAVDLASPLHPPPYRELTIAWADEAHRSRRIAFQPHGIAFSNASGLLYAVSHGLDAAGGSRVIAFRVSGRSFADAALEHVRDVVSPSVLYSGAPNSVVEGATPDELFVTVWRPCAIPKRGEAHPATLRDRACLVVNELAPLVGRLTYLVRCDLSSPPPAADAALGATASCSRAAGAGAFYMANGLTSDGGDTLFVVDAGDDGIVEVRRSPDGSLRRVGRLRLPDGFSADNVDFARGARGGGASRLLVGGSTHMKATVELPVGFLADEVEFVSGARGGSTRLLVGGLTHLGAKQAYKKDLDVPRDVPGAVLAFERDAPGAPWRVVPLVVSEGRARQAGQLSMLSEGAQWGRRVAVGSPFSTGVLVCDV